MTVINTVTFKDQNCPQLLKHTKEHCPSCKTRLRLEWMWEEFYLNEGSLLYKKRRTRCPHCNSTSEWNHSSWDKKSNKEVLVWCLHNMKEKK